MTTAKELRAALHAIDHKSYPAYKSLSGSYRFPEYVLFIDHVQGDPFAAPSSLHVEISLRDARFPEEYYVNQNYRIALQDHLTRLFADRLESFRTQAKGSGKSGLLSVSRCGQEVLERSACQITKGRIYVRFRVGFPAFGRTIHASELEKILFEFLPDCIRRVFFCSSLDQKRMRQALFLYDDQQALRQILHQEKLAAFVADGSVLPRKSGVSDLPMKDCVPFSSPASMRRTFQLPHKGAITGMAIPQGITLIVGGGYYGKSTLLEALQMGVYNHIAGDGREYVITDETAVKLRAEDGRSIRNVDISMFIKDLPNKKDTTSFSTPDASGSTSQAAGIAESLEADTKLFLIDEDTSATNFMLRDDLMQEVIAREKEPITPFLERARDLYEKAGVSTILVAGSSGAFFYIADQILQMDSYLPIDITEKVKQMCLHHQAPRIHAPKFALPDFHRTLLLSSSGRSGHEKGRTKIKMFGKDSFSLDRSVVDLRYVEQLADEEQTFALACFLRYASEQSAQGTRTVRQTVQFLTEQLEAKGWEPFCSSFVPCGLAKPRIQEIYTCLNRFRV